MKKITKVRVKIHTKPIQYRGYYVFNSYIVKRGHTIVIEGPASTSREEAIEGLWNKIVHGSISTMAEDAVRNMYNKKTVDRVKEEFDIELSDILKMTPEDYAKKYVLPVWVREVTE